MKIRLIGLGKMGANIAKNLRDHNHEVIGFARSESTRNEMKNQGFIIADSVEDLFAKREEGRIVVWLLIPNQSVDEMLEQVLPYLKQSDIIIDGGNSNFHLSMKRYAYLKEKQINFVDLGTSGGTNGARNGVCLMFGGDKEVFDYLEPVLKDISATDGYAYMGGAGAGHFVKMVHNGIEYGMMQAIGEGFELMKQSGLDLDLERIANVWNHGSIIESSLIKNVKDALKKDAKLEAIQGRIDDSGEGMWFVEESLKNKVSTPIITTSLYTRFKSRDSEKFSEKVVAAMRNEFGGHAVYPKK